MPSNKSPILGVTGFNFSKRKTKFKPVKFWTSRIWRERAKFEHHYGEMNDYYVYSEGDEKMSIGTASMNDNMYLACSDQSDIIRSNIRAKRIEMGQSIFIRQTQVLCSKDSLTKYIESQYKSAHYNIIQTQEGSGIVIEPDLNRWFEYYCGSNSVKIQAHGDEDWANVIINLFETEFTVVTSHIDWIYTADGSSISIPLNNDRLPIDEMYPFLGDETLAEYYDRYMKSSASILLLIGKPGTGKTSFIRGLLEHTKSSATVTYDPAILQKDYIFANFIEGDSSVMVLEDADNFLKARSEGNTMMHRFLNLGDGLVTTAGKKLIFSTNLPSIRDIDSALTRPGRCFDILSFDELTQEQAEKLAAASDATLNEKRNHWTIAEVFNQSKNEQANKPTERTVGFL